MIYQKQQGKTTTIANITADGTIVLPVLSVIDQYRILLLAQTTAGVTLSMPTPQDSSVPLALDVMNTGTVAVILNGTQVQAGKAVRALWDKTKWLVSATQGPVSVPFGDGVAKSFDLKHNLKSLAVVGKVRDTATGDWVYPEMRSIDGDTVRVFGFATAPTLNEFTADFVLGGSLSGAATPPTPGTTDTVSLATLPADVWTAVPSSAINANPLSITVRDNAGNDITHAVAIRKSGAAWELASSTTLNNLSITLEG